MIGWYVARGQALPSLAAAASVLYLAGVTSVGCTLIWFHVLRAHGASFGAGSLFVQPVVGAALGIVVLGDALTPGLAAAGGLVLTALALLTLERRPDARQEKPFARPQAPAWTEDGEASSALAPPSD